MNTDTQNLKDEVGRLTTRVSELEVQLKNLESTTTIPLLVGSAIKQWIADNS